MVGGPLRGPELLRENHSVVALPGWPDRLPGCARLATERKCLPLCELASCRARV